MTSRYSDELAVNLSKLLDVDLVKTAKKKEEKKEEKCKECGKEKCECAELAKKEKEEKKEEAKKEKEEKKEEKKKKKSEVMLGMANELFKLANELDEAGALEASDLVDEALQIVVKNLDK